MWKDDAINTYIAKIFSLISDNIRENYREIIFVMEFDVGYAATSAVYYDANGVKHGVADFFSISETLKKYAAEFHQEFSAKGENFRCAKVVIDSDDSFEIDFDYDKLNRWDLSNIKEFPRQK